MVDIFNATSGNWTTATLSQARYWLAATSVRDVALFAGGFNSSGMASATVDIFNATSRTWSNATLSQARGFLAAASFGDVALFAGGSDSSDTMYVIVDIFNATSGIWSTAALSQARDWLTATSVGEMALFAGGSSSTGLSNVVDLYNPLPPTQSPAILPIVQDVKANFSDRTPAVNISAPLGSSPAQIGLGVEFDPAEMAATANVSFGSVYTVTNNSGEAKSTVLAYRSLLINALSNATLGYLDQVFSFSTSAQEGSLYAQNSTFTIPPAAVKWSLRINTSTPLAGGINIAFSLADLSLSTTAAAAAINGTVHSTGRNISSAITATTYHLPLLNQQQGEPVALLEVLDWALVDGVLMAIDHSVLPSGNATTSGGTAYTLILQFPAFDNSIEYDPSLNLGIVLGPQSGSGGGSADLGLIVGTAVGVSAAVIVVGLVIATATVGGILLAKRRHNALWLINFDGTKNDEVVPSPSL